MKWGRPTGSWAISVFIVPFANIPLCFFVKLFGVWFFHWKVTHRTDILQRAGIDAPINCRQNKHALFGQQEGLCNGCGVVFPFRDFLSDLKIPRSRRGIDHLENQQLLCAVCNSLKGDRPQEDTSNQCRFSTTMRVCRT